MLDQQRYIVLPLLVVDSSNFRVVPLNTEDSVDVGVPVEPWEAWGDTRVTFKSGMMRDGQTHRVWLMKLQRKLGRHSADIEEPFTSIIGSSPTWKLDSGSPVLCGFSNDTTWTPTFDGTIELAESRGEAVRLFARPNPGPDPGTGDMAICYDLKAEATSVRLIIMDLSGNVVFTNADMPTKPGLQCYPWPVGAVNGPRPGGYLNVSNGVYLGRLDIRGGPEDTGTRRVKLAVLR